MSRVGILALLVLLSCTARGDQTNQPTESLTLSQAQALALKLHPQVAAADYRALAAEEVVRETRAGYFPSANLYGTAAGADQNGERITAGGLNSPAIFNKAAVGLSVNQLLTDFGRTANLTASSKYAARAENQKAAATREQVLLDVDRGYLGALQAQAVLRVAQQTLTTRQYLLEQVSTLASNRLRSQLDVSFAQVALQEGRLLVQRSQNDADAAMATLSAALGYREYHTFQLAEDSPAIAASTNDISGLVETALQDRPELLSLRSERDSALRYARAQRDSRLPTLSLVGAAGEAPVRSDGLNENYAVGGAQVSVPLFEGGLYTARQHEAERRADAAAETLRSLEDIVVRDVRIAWLNLNSAQQQLRTTAQLVQHANEAFDLATARYKVGSSSIVELSQAQLELTSAQIADTSAHYDLLIQQANLNYQIGQMGGTNYQRTNAK